jgi:hypothetical protein
VGGGIGGGGRGGEEVGDDWVFSLSLAVLSERGKEKESLMMTVMERVRKVWLDGQRRRAVRLRRRCHREDEKEHRKRV